MLWLCGQVDSFRTLMYIDGMRLPGVRFPAAQCSEGLRGFSGLESMKMQNCGGVGQGVD